jgi:hypothetical protein
LSSKKSLSIGINYAGTPYALGGCVNDADDWASLFGRHGFQAAVLPEKQATRANIMSGIATLVGGLTAGDVAAITFSGHGTWLPDQDGDEPDGRDEALVPADVGDDGSGLIVDDELHAVFGKIPAGAQVLFVTDSCHSGSVFRFAAFGPAAVRVRFLPPSVFAKSAEFRDTVEAAYTANRPNAKKRGSDAPLPGLVHFSACKDTEYANDISVAGRGCGAFSHFAVPAFADALVHGKTYADVYRAIRDRLPSRQFPQSPLFNADASLKGAKVFGAP